MKEKLKNNIIKGSTPVMRQFWKAKEAYPDSIMLFRMGDFYETFDEDAKIASNLLGIALTKRSNGAASSVPLAGFPYHSLDQYLYKLLSNGHRVAICEQVEDPKLSKGIVKREVVELLSPGAAIAEKYLNHKENNFLLSLYFNKNLIGYSLLDYSTGEFTAGDCKISDLINIVKQYNVKELILPRKQKQFIDDLNIDVLVTTYNDWIANQEICYEKLIEHFNTVSLKGFGFNKNEISIIAAGSIIGYVQENYFGKINHITTLSKIKNDKIMIMDSATIKNLELFNSFSSNNSKGSLIETIDFTCTAMGSRLLKNHLNFPSTSKDIIELRLKLLDEYILSYKNNDLILNKMKSLSDIPRIISRITTGKSNPRDLINLCISLQNIESIKQITSKNKFLSQITKKIKRTLKIVNQINKSIIDDPPVNINNGGYIRNGISKKLDKLRYVSNNAQDWIVKYQEVERKKLGISSLKISYNRVFGYYIDITKTHINKVPDHYIRKQTLTNSERYFTEDLKNYEDQILSSKDSIILIEKEIYDNIVSEILKNIKDIQFNSNIISQLDVIISHSQIALKNNYSRPKISSKKSKNINLLKSRHPVIENLLQLNDKFITNDLELNKNKKQIAIITGPNMAGKSTFLRQVALNVILAQMGSYVPSEKAEISIVDQLFTRVGASDNLSGGESTFLVEMNETANILNNATSNSLIILDEVGRGTSTYDGLSLAWSITEYIHNNKKIKAKTLFATHYHELIELANELPNAFNLNVLVEEDKDDIIFLRKIKEGAANKSYGINVAKMAGLPSYVIQRANELLIDFMDNKKMDITSEKNKISQIEIFNKSDELKNKIDKINIENMTPLEALQVLSDLKKNKT